ncbi:hypothetical protein [Streptomyces sp. Tu6071]|uniref:hypothetical protein n=1 Tax=Streptomyces sp. Tu6071 TaxID=355249 RepID=UPI0002E969BA|nr:hypothetical protein [Streptomyces sp. Tu6071]
MSTARRRLGTGPQPGVPFLLAKRVASDVEPRIPAERLLDVPEAVRAAATRAVADGRRVLGTRPALLKT